MINKSFQRGSGHANVVEKLICETTEIMVHATSFSETLEKLKFESQTKPMKVNYFQSLDLV